MDYQNQTQSKVTLSLFEIFNKALKNPQYAKFIYNSYEEHATNIFKDDLKEIIFWGSFSGLALTSLLITSFKTKNTLFSFFNILSQFASSTGIFYFGYYSWNVYDSFPREVALKRSMEGWGKQFQEKKVEQKQKHTEQKLMETEKGKAALNVLSTIKKEVEKQK